MDECVNFIADDVLFFKIHHFFRPGIGVGDDSLTVDQQNDVQRLLNQRAEKLFVVANDFEVFLPRGLRMFRRRGASGAGIVFHVQTSTGEDRSDHRSIP